MQFISCRVLLALLNISPVWQHFIWVAVYCSSRGISRSPFPGRVPVSPVIGGAAEDLRAARSLAEIPRPAAVFRGRKIQPGFLGETAGLVPLAKGSSSADHYPRFSFLGHVC